MDSGLQSVHRPDEIHSTHPHSQKGEAGIWHNVAIRFVTSTLCAATFSNSYVKWCLRYVILRFVGVPDLPLFPVCLSCFIPQGFFLWDKQKTDAGITGKATPSLHPRHPGPERVFHLATIFRGQTVWKWTVIHMQMQCKMTGNVVVFLALEKTGLK